MSKKIKVLQISQQNNDGNNQNEDRNDFSRIYMDQSSQGIQKPQIMNQVDIENDFNQFLEPQNSQKFSKDDKIQQDQAINLFKNEDGSIQFKQIQQDNVSNQNSGLIPQDMNYNQNSYNFDCIQVSHYNCQQPNQYSQEFERINPEYDGSGVIRFIEVSDIQLDIFERYYGDEICNYLQPIQYNQLEEEGMSDQQTLGDFDEKETQIIQNSDEIIEQDIGQIKKKKTKRGNRKNKNKNKNKQISDEQEDEEQIDQEYQLESKVIQDINIESTNQYEMGNIEELDDAVSEEFKIKITNFLEQNEKSKISLTQTIYGNKEKSIKIIEIKDYENQIQKLCKQFSNLKYSEIALSLQLIVNFENCQQFLLTLKPQQEKLIIREINQLIVDEQKAIESGDNAELTKSKYKIDEFKKVNNKIEFKDQSLLQTAIKIIEQKNFKFDIKKCDQQTKQQKQTDFEENRNQVIAINNKKAKIIKQYKTCNINEQQCNQQLQQIRVEKKKLEKIGKNLFLDLMVIDNGFCRIDFHKFFSAEIEHLLDGIFEKIESYKLCNQQKQIKLQIIVGKGLHSKDQKPIIGPITKQYIQQYLQQQVEIIEGKIDVII